MPTSRSSWRHLRRPRRSSTGCRAEYDILTRAPSAAESLERLREAVRASPFRFLDRELERLERLGGAAGPSAG
jgi:hypothetical protein